MKEEENDLNSRAAESPVDAVSAISEDEREERRVALAELVEVMSEAVREDGGDLVLVDADYENGIIDVELQGACGSCAISGITLQGGVERMLKDRLPWVTEVRGGVDESLDFETSFAMGRGAYIPRA
jgi:Fe-S cluster biogenesis protein NfuA